MQDRGGEGSVVNLVLASLRFARTSLSLGRFLPSPLLQLCEKKTKSAFSQTRYTDSDLASLEPRLFHSK